MTKRARKTVPISKGITALLFLGMTGLLVTVTLLLSGKTYKKIDPEPFREIKILHERLSEGMLPFRVIVELGMPVLLNMLLFLPWGFFLFVLLDNEERTPLESYVLVFMLAFGFSSLVEAWQYFLPTRVMDVNDVIWNVCGAVA
ncbi:MAG: VanZ family protein, partial [Thermoanaerobaculia bacterium]|nr:VanZ family protein [Thermoanaerobaculia bacterium]